MTVLLERDGIEILTRGGVKTRVETGRLKLQLVERETVQRTACRCSQRAKPKPAEEGAAQFIVKFANKKAAIKEVATQGHAHT